MEEFTSIQGEGTHTGTAAYFIRIGGCDVGCYFCDVKESWDASLHALSEVDEIVGRVINSKLNAVVITGGEPLLYDLSYLTKQLKKAGVSVFLETSGSEPLRGHFDWICLSPKKNSPPLEDAFKKAHELKMIVCEPADLALAEDISTKTSHGCRLLLQPEWSVAEKMLPYIFEYILHHPYWHLSLQSHKYIGIP